MTLDASEPSGAALLVVVGVAAGLVNMLAGGGSLLTLPVLMWVGLPADIANGTNRLSVMSQSFAGALAFDASGKLDRKRMAGVVTPTLGGALVGAYVASILPVPVLKPVLVGGLLLVAPTLLYRPRVSAAAESEADGRSRLLGGLDRLSLFAIGVYGGFLQAGVGIFLLAFLAGRLRYDLVRANALKVVCVAAFTVVALGVFIIQGQVAWLAGAMLTLGTVTGARLGVRVAVRASQTALRRIVFVAVVACAIGAALR